MSYDPERSPESSGVPLSRELFDLIDHTAIIIDHLDDRDSCPVPSSSDVRLAFDWKTLDEAIVPDVVQNAIESDYKLTDVTIKATRAATSHSYSLSVEFILAHRHQPPVHIAAVLMANSRVEYIPTGWQEEASDKVAHGRMSTYELKTFLYSLIYDQDEIEIDSDEIIRQDISMDATFDALIPYFKCVSSSYSVVNDYKLPTPDRGDLEIRSEEYGVKPDTRVVQAYVTYRFPANDTSRFRHASAYIDLAQHDPVELYLYADNTDPSQRSLVMVDAGDARVKDMLDAIRSAAAETPRGREYFVSNQTLQAMYDDPAV